jgi:hypothetical protein
MFTKFKHLIACAAVAALASTASASTLVAFDNFDAATGASASHPGSNLEFYEGTVASGHLAGLDRVTYAVIADPLVDGYTASAAYTGMFTGALSLENGHFEVQYGEFTNWTLQDLSMFDGFYIDVASATGDTPFDVTMTVMSSDWNFYEADFTGISGSGIYTLDRSAFSNDVTWDSVYGVIFGVYVTGNDATNLSLTLDSFGGITGGDPTVIPVPPAAGLILLGMVGMGLRRQFMKK